MKAPLAVAALMATGSLSPTGCSSSLPGLQPLDGGGSSGNSMQSGFTESGGGTAADASDDGTLGDSSSGTESCPPNEQQCSGNSVQICSASGQWGAATACPDTAPFCNGAGVCGICESGTAQGCGTGNVCNSGTCIAGCLIASLLYTPDEASPDNACQTCQPPASTAAFTPAPEGASCGSGQGTCTAAGACLVTMASGQSQPTGIAVDGVNVYWANAGGCGSGTIVKMPIDGGTITTLATDQCGEYGIAVDQTNVYWANNTPTNGSVMKCAIDGCGGAPTTLAAGDTYPMTVIVNATTVFWSGASGNINSVPILGGTPVPIATTQRFTWGLLLQPPYIYWTAPGTDNTVVRSLLDGGSLTALAQGQEYPTGIAVDANNIYWVDCGSPECAPPVPGDGDVMALPLDGGSPMTLASGQGLPYALALSDGVLYWTDVNGGNVMSVSTAGGPPVTLASGQDSPNWIVVDATSIYWTNKGGGTVMKLTPKQPTTN